MISTSRLRLLNPFAHKIDQVRAAREKSRAVLVRIFRKQFEGGLCTVALL